MAQMSTTRKGDRSIGQGRAPDVAKDDLMSDRFVINELFKILDSTDGAQIDINGTTARLSK